MTHMTGNHSSTYIAQKKQFLKPCQAHCAIHAVHAPPTTFWSCCCMFLSKLIQHLRAICATILRQSHWDDLAQPTKELVTTEYTNQAWLWQRIRDVPFFLDDIEYWVWDMFERSLCVSETIPNSQNLLHMALWLCAPLRHVQSSW